MVYEMIIADAGQRTLKFGCSMLHKLRLSIRSFRFKVLPRRDHPLNV